MINRREFLTAGTALITGLPCFSRNATASKSDIELSREHLDPGINLVRDGITFAKKGRKTNVPPVLREEILDNPNAVFIIRTNFNLVKDIDGKFPAEKERFALTGYMTANKIFRKGYERGGKTYIKPNFVSGFDADERNLNNGTATHPFFVAGFCDALKELGNTNIIVNTNGALEHESFVESGISQMMHERDVCFVNGRYKSFNDYQKSDITWVDYHEGVVMREIPFFNPVLDKDTTFINIAKDRIHNLAVTTLTIKNLQGIMPYGYMRICGPWPSDLTYGVLRNVFNPNYRQDIERLYQRHANEGFKYWDILCHSKEYYGAGGWNAFQKGEFQPNYLTFRGEQWGQRIMDIASNVHPCINMVEGIVGIDGADVLHLNNFITISQSMVACDSVASWLMGHDPRELYYLRIARERGLGENNIERIPIFEITDNSIEQVKDYRILPRAHMGVIIHTLGKELRFF